MSSSTINLIYFPSQALNNQPDLFPKSSYKQANIFIAGMIPSPTEPEMTKISHILSPPVDELLMLNTGVFIKTHNFPIRQWLSIHLGALIGNILVSHKIADFSLHLANFFCSWCKCKESELMHMQIGRNLKQCEAQVQALWWRGSSTLSNQTQFLKHHGTCWSELNCLPYWDSVKNLAKGSCSTISVSNGHLNPIHSITSLKMTVWKILRTTTQRTQSLAVTS
ncbi:hypothetical protein VP01_7g27 [Puccinia sorghi]|uniref:Uncharacterized protein n=1 Tax=Puccinia sorghi TaxID=27349 RepID=A0A0L6UBE3_9BASI|nr:hypothetical protein VP01_7g27 [Puccinia sorghi]